MEKAKTKFITVKGIEEEYGISRSFIWKLRQHEEFPKAVELPVQRVLFRRVEIERYMDSI